MQDSFSNRLRARSVHEHFAPVTKSTSEVLEAQIDLIWAWLSWPCLLTAAHCVLSDRSCSRAIADAQQQLTGVSVQMLERPPVSSAANAALKPFQTGSSSRCTAGAGSGGSSSIAAASQAPVTEAQVRITGSDQQQVLAARRLLEPVLARRLFAGAGQADVAALTPAGKAGAMPAMGKGRGFTPGPAIPAGFGGWAQLQTWTGE